MNLAMDKKTYKVNECVVLCYLMEASQLHTFQLFNGKIYNEMVVKKNVTCDVLGFKGKKLKRESFLARYISAYRSFTQMINGEEKFGYPPSKSRPSDDAAEQKAWDEFYECISAEIQIIVNVCGRKSFRNV